MDRLRGPQPLLASSQLPDQLNNVPPPRPERPDALFPQDAFLMVKATQRTAIPPPLSITIPQGVTNERRSRSRDWEDDQDNEEYADLGTPTNSEPFPKQVKFLAPEDGDEEDGMSEQSSICQSPSWEGYGQRKKDKKLQAERRKKEKELAEKEAKAAKKRNTGRLSKAPPPPVTANRDSKAPGLTAADRSMSDPLLVSRHPLQGTRSTHRPEEVGRTASADDFQQARWHQVAMTEVLSSSPSKARHAGGAMRDQSPSAIPHHLLCDDTFAPRHELRRSISEGPALPTQHSPSTFSAKHESRSPQDAFPPSASRTPRLRHMSPSGGNHGTNPFPGGTSTNNSQESLAAASTVDGARRNGYVHNQRAQAAERAMAGLADEQLVANVGQYYPPSRSSSLQTQHARRPSITHEAKSAAMKLVGMKTPLSARDDVDQTDYLTFKAIPYSSSDMNAPTSAGSMPTSPRSVDGAFRLHGGERPTTSGGGMSRSANGFSEISALPGRPTTSQSSTNSSDPSISGSDPNNHNKKNRTLKDAAKAALSMPKAPPKTIESPKPSISVPPYLRLRARLQARTSAHKENKASHAVVETASDPVASVRPFQPRPLFILGSKIINKVQTSKTPTSVADQAKPTEIVPQEGSRASEGSSSSSGYDDGSPLQSPTTTPDTSRPQSAKDIPVSASGLTKESPQSFGPQDDERTVRQSPDSSESSTPRIGDPEVGGTAEMGDEDRWSRTALPIDIDCDAQSFMTSVSNFDNVDDTDKVASNSPFSPKAKTEQPEPLGQISNPDLQAEDVRPAISIPPRSRKRSQTTPDASPVASHSSEERQRGEVGTVHGPMGVSRDYEGSARMEDSAGLGMSGNYARPSEQAEQEEIKEEMPRRSKRNHPRKHTKPLESESVGFQGQRDDEGGHAALPSPQRDWTSGSITSASSTVPSAGPASPNALTTNFQIPSNPYFNNLPESLDYNGALGEVSSSAGPPSPISLPSPLHGVPSKAPAQPRANSAPLPSLASMATSRASTPSVRASGIVPVSILKQPKSSTPDSASPSTSRPPVLSAIPKHMQLQAGVPVRPPTTVAEARMAPIAKMFVECCSCKFYHDMPSKLYECMAKPDAVVEDKLLGISGAITTMVKCPWCQHNMSRNCCAGYAAVVYLKEKLH